MGSHKYFPYKLHKLFWALSQILPLYPTYYPTWALTQIHTTTKIGPQNYTISTKSLNSFTLWAKLKKPVAIRHPKARCYTVPLKFVVIWHPKACCYTTLLQSLLRHGNIFYKISNCLQKPKYYFGNYLQKPNTILVTIYKSPNTILATIYKTQYYFGNYLQKAQYYFGNFILASSKKKKKKKKKKKPQNYWANNYSTKAQMLFGKRIILCSKPKTIL